MTDADQALDLMRQFVNAGEWTFAKTMPYIPHYYRVRQKDRARGVEALFDDAVMIIIEHGYTARWRSHPPRRYLELDGWRYWVMEPFRDDQPQYTTVINRADANDTDVVRVADEQLRLDL